PAAAPPPLIACTSGSTSRTGSQLSKPSRQTYASQSIVLAVIISPSCWGVNGPCWSPFTTTCHTASSPPPAAGAAAAGGGCDAACWSPRTTMTSLHFLQRILNTFPATFSSAIEYFAPQLSQTIFMVPLSSRRCSLRV